MRLNDTFCSTNGSGIYLSADSRQIISRETTQGSNTSCIALRAGVGVVSAVAGIVVILLAVVIFRYKLSARGETKLNPAAQLRGVPSQQPPYELESTRENAAAKVTGKFHSTIARFFVYLGRLD